MRRVGTGGARRVALGVEYGCVCGGLVRTPARNGIFAARRVVAGMFVYSTCGAAAGSCVASMAGWLGCLEEASAKRWGWWRTEAGAEANGPSDYYIPSRTPMAISNSNSRIPRLPSPGTNTATTHTSRHARFSFSSHALVPRNARLLVRFYIPSFQHNK